MKIENLFKKPKVIGISGDANSGKSNLIYHLISEARKKYKFKLYTYGLKFEIGDKKIYSIEELESIENSVIIIDEFFSLFDLEDRNKKKLIERTFRLMFHRNNVLLLCGLPENFKKFISNKLNVTIFMKNTLGDFINGSKIKNNCLSYKGDELGYSILNLPPSNCLFFDGSYIKLDVPYYSRFDSKKSNEDILKTISKKDVVKKPKVKI